MSDDPDYREILLQLIGSLTLADHMGDVAEDVTTALALAEVEVEGEWDTLDDLRNALGEMGVTTLYGSPLGGQEADDDN